MEQEKQKSTNNHSNKKPKKQYILKKDKDINDLIKVKESFSDPEQFFKKQKKMVIGHFPSKITAPKSFPISTNFVASPINTKQKKLQKFKNNIRPKSKSFTMNAEPLNNDKNKYKLIRNFSSSNKNNPKYKYKSALNNLENTNCQNDSVIHYQIKSLGDMLKIFKTYKNIEEENKARTKSIVFGNEKMPSEIIKEIGKNFFGQEKALNHQKKVKNESVLFSKVLSKKTKRQENDLLYNKIEEFRLKRQLIDLMEKSKSVQEKFGDNYWVANLRRPKTHKDIRLVYSNTTKNISPEMIIDYADKDIEFISDPSLQNSSRYSHLLKNLITFKKTHQFKYPNFEKMAEIEMIKGKNILEQEFSYFSDLKENNKNKYRIYKDPLELKKKYVKDLTCKESYDVKYRIQRNRSYSNEESKIQNVESNKRRGLYRSKSLLSGIGVKDKNKKKVSYLKQAFKMLQKENKQRESSIKFLRYK